MMNAPASNKKQKNKREGEDTCQKRKWISWNYINLGLILGKGMHERIPAAILNGTKRGLHKETKK